MKRRLPPIYYYHTSCVCVCVCVFLKGRKDRADHEDQDAETGAIWCTIIIIVVVVVVIIERKSHHYRRRSRKLYNCKLHEKKLGMQTIVIRNIVDSIPGIYQDEKKKSNSNSDGFVGIPEQNFQWGDEDNETSSYRHRHPIITKSNRRMQSI